MEKNFCMIIFVRSIQYGGIRRFCPLGTYFYLRVLIYVEPKIYKDFELY